MSNITANIVVESNQITITPQPLGNVNITSQPVSATIALLGNALPGGNVGELQFNNGGRIGGTSNIFFDGSNIVSDTDTFKLIGGDNGLVLQTDGTGNLTWTQQIAGDPGNGSPGGANTQIQFNDEGLFGGNAGFTFNKTTGNVNIPGIINGDGFGISNIAGANVVGEVANANFATSAGSANTANSATIAASITDNAQPNITSVGSLTDLSVSGNVSVNGTITGSNGATLTATSNNQVVIERDNGTGLRFRGKDIAGANVQSYAGIFSNEAYGTTNPTKTRLIVGSNEGMSLELQTSNEMRISAVDNNTGGGKVRIASGDGNGSPHAIEFHPGTQAEVDNLVAKIDTSGLEVVGNISAANLSTGGTLSVSGNANIDSLLLKKYQETVESDSVSGTITPDAGSATIFDYTLTGNITINSLANAVAGTSVTLILKQDNVGFRELSSSMLFANGQQTLSIAPEAIDVLGIFFDGTTYYASLTKGYQ